MIDDTAEYQPERKPMADTNPTPAPVPIMPTSAMAQSIAAFFDGLTKWTESASKILPEMGNAAVKLITLAGALGAGFYSFQSHSTSTTNAASIAAVAAKVDESAKLMTSRPVNAWANPTTTPVPAPVPTR